MSILIRDLVFITEAMKQKALCADTFVPDVFSSGGNTFNHAESDCKNKIKREPKKRMNLVASVSRGIQGHTTRIISYS